MVSKLGITVCWKFPFPPPNVVVEKSPPLTNLALPVIKPSLIYDRLFPLSMIDAGFLKAWILTLWSP